MGAFITNFQAPKEMDDFLEYYDDGFTNLDIILDNCDFEDIYWTVPSNAEAGDVVFFMCAKTSVDRLKHLRRIIRNEDDGDLLDFIEEQVARYEEYAGKIIALGFVKDKPYRESNDECENRYWKSQWYAEIDNIKLLRKPIDIKLLSEAIKINTFGAITRLNRQQTDLILDNIKD